MKGTKDIKPLVVAVDVKPVVNLALSEDSSTDSGLSADKVEVGNGIVADKVEVGLVPDKVEVVQVADKVEVAGVVAVQTNEEDNKSNMQLVVSENPYEGRLQVLESNRFGGMTMNDVSLSIYKKLEQDIKSGIVTYELDRRDQAFWSRCNSRRQKSHQPTMDDQIFRRVVDYLEKNSLSEALKMDSVINHRIEDLQREMWETVCAICGKVEGSPMDSIPSRPSPMAQCHDCLVSYHTYCGTMSARTCSDGGTVQQCEVCAYLADKADNNGAKREDIECVLCPNKEGPFKPTTQGGWVHYTCALWSKETYFTEEFLGYVEGVDTIPKSRFNLKCTVCKVKSGAPMQCDGRNCRVAYHGSCAKKAGFTMMVVDEGYVSLCGKHSLPKVSDLAVVKFEEGASRGGRKRKRPVGFYPLDSASQKFPKLDLVGLNNFANSVDPSADFFVALKEIITYWQTRRGQTKDDVLHPIYKQAFQVWKNSRTDLNLTSLSKHKMDELEKIVKVGTPLVVQITSIVTSSRYYEKSKNMTLALKQLLKLGDFQRKQADDRFDLIANVIKPLRKNAKQNKRKELIDGSFELEVEQHVESIMRGTQRFDKTREEHVKFLQEVLGRCICMKNSPERSTWAKKVLIEVDRIHRMKKYIQGSAGGKLRPQAIKPEPSTSSGQPQPGTSASLEEPQPGTSASLEEPQPGISASLEEPQPGTSVSLGEPQPGTSASLEEPQPRTSASLEESQPGTSTSLEEPQPGTSVSSGEPQPGTSTSLRAQRWTSASLGEPQPGTSTSLRALKRWTSASLGEPQPGTSTSSGDSKPKPPPKKRYRAGVVSNTSDCEIIHEITPETLAPLKVTTLPLLVRVTRSQTKTFAQAAM